MTVTTPGATPHTPTSEEFIEAQRSPEFQELRHAIRSFTFPLTIAGIVWFTAYISLAMYAPELYGMRLVGNINLGIVLGLGQFLSTFLITWAYVRYAERNIEPRSSALRHRLENPQG
ncbi:DUF485 domain-containing protein [Corynebacterium lowii]|uniref:Inner membrane protein YjcH n=1 Tax=Corynebacterium lowii TaxID=1544413 RepID=A0A0Q0UE17_9CORY|nr:DUF485 domain-containing protein [Corynebacterium lowii]KQB84840.1 hypothetical protein Clow_02102 [Corynebacterium lowii]MDP9851744.1 uncharacterized membrane protein (DUF485 family) [Corynebacterium lowii]